MRLVTFSTDEERTPRLGAYLNASLIVDIQATLLASGAGSEWLGGVNSVGELLRAGDSAMNAARELMNRIGRQASGWNGAILHEADRVSMHPPTSQCAKIMCVTMNYDSHANASNSKAAPEPYFFLKFSSGMTPHMAPIVLSKTSLKCDSEIELVVVIGKRGKYIPSASAFHHIAGYTIGNDFSFRDRRMLKSDPNGARLHWFTLKNLDTAAPIGPCLVTKDEIADPYALEIALSLDNDPDERVSGSTAGMLHKIPELVALASDGLTLEPGDLIFTGTPHPVAFGHERYLKDGDILRAEITGIGALVNPALRES